MASTRLTRTVGAGNRQTWTWSAWIKRTQIFTAHMIMGTYVHAADNFRIYFTDTDKLVMRFYNNTEYLIATNRLFRDTSAWYHLVFVADTTNATSGDRFRMYVNGVRETSFSSQSQPTQNLNMSINDSNTLEIGSFNNADFFDGSMAHVNFVDGTALDASYFGETDSTTGIWKPKTAPSVTYGTNGFFLKMENSASMGTDSSGNSNNFTVNGTLTQTIDTPSNVFAVLNAVNKGSNVTLSNGGTSYSTNDSWESAPSTLAFSKGKWYAEFKPTSVLGSGNSFVMFGVDSTVNTNSWINQYPGYSSQGYAYGWDGDKRNNGSNTSYGSSFSQNDIIGVAVDMDNKYIYFHKNGTYQNSGDPTSGATGTGGLALTGDEYYFIGSGYNNGANSTFASNFGNGYFGTTAVSSAGTNAGVGTFEYDVPSGYKALCTKNINAQEYS